MAKPYSQDLRDRVIDAVERGEMSGPAQRRVVTRSATPWRSSDLSGLNGTARESLSDMAAIALPSPEHEAATANDGQSIRGSSTRRTYSSMKPGRRPI